MEREELIKALRCKSNDINDYTMCAYHNACYGGTLAEIAADALEEADEQIADCVAAIDALDDSNDAYIKENERLKKRIARLEEDLKTREAEREVMQDTIKICEEWDQYIERERAAEKIAIEEDLNRRRRELEELKRELEELNRKVNDDNADWD